MATWREQYDAARASGNVHLQERLLTQRQNKLRGTDHMAPEQHKAEMDFVTQEFASLGQSDETREEVRRRAEFRAANQNF
jgi:hypothetical protein